MKRRSFLISAVGGDLGQSVIKCLKDSDFNARITGCDNNPHAAGRAEADLFIETPPASNTGQYRAFLEEAVKEREVQYVFLLSEAEIRAFHEDRDFFEKLPARFVVQEAHLIDTFSDKYRTAEFLKARGLPYPHTYLPSDYDGQLDFPMILKRRRGSGGRGLRKVFNSTELHFYMERDRDMIIQQYLPGDSEEYTSGIFRDGRNIFTITFRRKLSPGGFSQQAELIADSDIDRFLHQVFSVIDFTGPLNIQFRRTPQGFIPFEINPRFSSTVYIRHLFGFRDVIWTIQLLEGEPVSYTPLYRKGIAVRKFDEVLFDTERI